MFPHLQNDSGQKECTNVKKKKKEEEGGRKNCVDLQREEVNSLRIKNKIKYLQIQVLNVAFTHILSALFLFYQRVDFLFS